jgi:hypothetical protein
MVSNMTQLSNGTKTKHVVIQLPGETVSRVVIDKNSLLWLAYSLKREYVWLHGYLDDYVSIRSLSSDLLRSKIIAYKIDGPRTLSVILEDSGYKKWSE